MKKILLLVSLAITAQLARAQSEDLKITMKYTVDHKVSIYYTNTQTYNPIAGIGGLNFDLRFAPGTAGVNVGSNLTTTFTSVTIAPELGGFTYRTAQGTDNYLYTRFVLISPNNYYGNNGLPILPGEHKIADIVIASGVNLTTMELVHPPSGKIPGGLPSGTNWGWYVDIDGFDQTNYTTPLYANAQTGVANNGAGGYTSESKMAFLAATLPVKLTNFNVTRNGNAANLSWSTASEVNFSHFEVEAQNAAGSWAKFATVTGGSSNSTVVRNYTLADATSLAKAINSKTSYRLKMVDKDGSFSYSEIRFISFDGKQLVSIYPNPTTNYVNISGLSGKTELVIVNGAGQQMARVITANTTETISLSNYASGTYYIRIVKDGQVTATEKVVKN